MEIGSKTTDEWGDEWRRVHTTEDEYIRVGIVQEGIVQFVGVT